MIARSNVQYKLMRLVTRSRLTTMVCTSILACWLHALGLGQIVQMDFRHLDYRDGLPDFGSIQSIVQDHQGRVWLGYDRGLFRYDGHEIVRMVHSPLDSHTVAEEFVGALFVAPDGRIWVGTANRGISIFDPITERFSHIRTRAEGGPLPNHRIWSIANDTDGTLWIATSTALVRFVQTTWTCDEFVFNQPGYTPRALNYLNDGRKTIKDPRNPNRLFYGTRGGLLSFDKSQQTFVHHRMPFADLRESDYMVNDLLFTDSTNLWLGTWSGYMVRYHTEDGTWKQFLDAADISGQGVIRTIARRNDHTLWVAGTPGFGYFDIQNGAYLYYRHDPKDQKAFGDLLIPGSLFFASDSTLMVVGRRGISISDPYPGYDASQEQFAPYLSEVVINGQRLQSDTVPAFLQQLKLEEDENTLQFKVAWPVFQDPRNVWYRYRLFGWDEGWNTVEHARFIQYTNLKGGAYRLEYEVSRDGMGWIPGRTLAFDIHLPVLKRPLVQVGLGLLIAGLLLLAYRTKIRRMRKQQAVEEGYHRRLAELEMTALRAQMNPHFMFNALNSIRNFILKEDTYSANKYLTKFAKLMRTILHNSRSRLVSVDDELTALRLYVDFESMRFKDKIQVDWFVDPSLDTRNTYLPPLIVQPYVENAIWHGLVQKNGAGCLNLRFERMNGELRITVHDNGVGRTKAAALKSKSAVKRKSYGMDITGHRIDLVKEMLNIDSDVQVVDLYDNRQSPCGTEVVITLPLIQDPLIK